jgi:glyoxylate utilization-related uncharacterized protein
MKKVELKNVKPYDPPKHFSITEMKLHDKESTGASNFIGLSNFLPGGGAKYDEGPMEKIYFVFDGEVTIKTPKEEITLKPWVSILTGPGEGRRLSTKRTCRRECWSSSNFLIEKERIRPGGAWYGR